MRLWPRSLYAQLVVILAGGMFAGQIMTGSIWFETHNNRTAEIPARLFASRLADMVRLLEKTPEPVERVRLAGLLQDARFTVRFIGAPSVAATAAETVPPSIARQSIQDLMAGVIARRLHQQVPLRLLHATLRGDSDAQRGIWAMFDSRAPTGDFTVQLALPTGEWVEVHALEGQAGMQTEPRNLILDYLTRIYALRFAAVFLLALIAVRLAVRPLKTFAAAAERLGRNIHHPPVDLAGPTEVRRAAESLNRMQGQLIANVGERTRMLAMISHDLRTPITKLRLRAEMLENADERAHFRADLIDMEAMLHEAIDFVRGVDVTEPRREVDIQSMLCGLAEDFRELGAHVVVDGAATRLLPGYAGNLRRCLQNLIENAVRHGTHVVIDVQDSADALRIAVQDDGPGVADAGRLAALNQARPYADSPTRATSPDASGINGVSGVSGVSGIAHAGLGLHIVRSVAAAHDATLRLSNRIDDAAIAGFEAVLIFPRV